MLQMLVIVWSGQEKEPKDKEIGPYSGLNMKVIYQPLYGSIDIITQIAQMISN
jgi:hypothetical protein